MQKIGYTMMVEVGCSIYDVQFENCEYFLNIN